MYVLKSGVELENPRRAKDMLKRFYRRRTRDTKRTSSRRDSLLRYNRQVCRLVEGGLGNSPKVDMMKFTKEEKETRIMTIEGHCRGSEKSHKKIKKK